MTDSTPLYFRSGTETLFGWLHRPSPETQSDVGVVICKPFGYEAVCAHGSLRAFADACAAIGITALRFDYAGTGDSSGIDSTADQIAGWCGDIRSAVDVLRESSGIRRVCLLGVRLGALLASRVAAADAVDALVAVAPVVLGRRYLRELRTFQAAAEMAVPKASTESTVPTAALAEAAARGGALEIAGFWLSAASVESLARTNLVEARRIVPHALVLDRADLPGGKDWADALGRAGAEVDYRVLPGFSDMVSTPHAALVPKAMLAAMVEWLDRYRSMMATSPPVPLARPEPSVLPASSAPPVSTEEPEACMTLRAASGQELIERAQYVDVERTLFAIVTRGAPGTQAGRSASVRGVVMLNGGATSHIGPNRMYVELARRWAAQGYVVLRLDLAGLGDSATRSGRNQNDVYPVDALDDIAAAIDFLRIRHGVENVTLAGLCAGAYHALRSAITGLPVDTVLLVNPLTFYWTQGASLNDLQIAEVVRNPGVYAEHLWGRKYWLKLFRGKVNLWRVALVFARRASLALESATRDVSRRLNIRLPHDLGRDLQAVAARGVRIVFLFARGDAGEALLKIQAGSAVDTLGERCRIHTINGADHIFTQNSARQRLMHLLSAELPK